MRPIRILGTGKFLPANTVSSADIDLRFGVPPGTVAEKTGVEMRHFVAPVSATGFQSQTAAEMGARALHQALANAGVAFADLDGLIATSGTPDQPIPCNAALIAAAFAALSNTNAGTNAGTEGGTIAPVFAVDVNSTCLSFLAGLDLVADAVASGRLRRVALVASDIASVGLNWQHLESCALLGDGAAAAIIGASGDSHVTGSSKILASAFATFTEGTDTARIAGGGSRLHASHFRPERVTDFLFHMDGPAIFTLARKHLPGLVEKLLAEANCTLDDLRLVIPHQASGPALRLVQKRLGVPDDKWFLTLRDVGNTVAASIPIGLHEAIATGKLARGDRFMLLGTSAGFSCGGMILEF